MESHGENANQFENSDNAENAVTESTVAQTASTEEKAMPQPQVSLAVFEAQMKKAKKKGAILGFIISLVVFCVIGVIVLGAKLTKSIIDGTIYAYTMSMGADSLIDKKTAEKINTIYGIIENDFIDEVDKEVIREGLYRGMMDALDDVYSVYYSKEEYDEMMEVSEGSFEGIGAYLSQDPDTMEITVVRPISGSPAEKVGIIAGDKIVRVDGEDVRGQDLNLVVSKVRGERGTVVSIGVERGGKDDLIYFDVTRDKVDEISCEGKMLDNNIGYIVVTEFADATDEQFKEAYDELKDDGMESLIIDLRSNGGGYVDTSVEMADYLIEDGVIVSLKDRHGKGYTYEDKGDEKYMTIPCVLLVDGNTASASEILTGALKDYGIATVIGTQTFGKGIVQDVIPLDDGSGLKITSSKYYTPEGNNIHKVGIEPDYVVEWDGEKYVEDGTDNQLEAAINYLLNGSIE